MLICACELFFYFILCVVCILIYMDVCTCAHTWMHVHVLYGGYRLTLGVLFDGSSLYIGSLIVSGAFQDSLAGQCVPGTRLLEPSPGLGLQILTTVPLI